MIFLMTTFNDHMEESGRAPLLRLGQRILRGDLHLLV